MVVQIIPVLSQIESPAKELSISCSPRRKKRHLGNQLFSVPHCYSQYFMVYFCKLHLQSLLCKNNEVFDMHYSCHEGRQVLFLGLLVYLSSTLRRGISS